MYNNDNLVIIELLRDAINDENWDKVIEALNLLDAEKDGPFNEYQENVENFDEWDE